MLLLRLPSRMFLQWRKCNCEANVVVIAKKAAAATVPGLTLAVKTSAAYCRWQQYWQLFAQNPAKVRNCIATAISVTTAHFATAIAYACAHIRFVASVKSTGMVLLQMLPRIFYHCHCENSHITVVTIATAKKA